MLNNLINFLSMGGYGHFIWGAFGLSAIVLIGLIIQILQFLKSSETLLHSIKEKTNETKT
nr:heme exporter protein CcmD [Rhodospirillales bacterium]